MVALLHLFPCRKLSPTAKPRLNRSSSVCSIADKSGLGRRPARPFTGRHRISGHRPGGILQGPPEGHFAQERRALAATDAAAERPLRSQLDGAGGRLARHRLALQLFDARCRPAAGGAHRGISVSSCRRVRSASASPPSASALLLVVTAVVGRRSGAQSPALPAKPAKTPPPLERVLLPVTFTCTLKRRPKRGNSFVPVRVVRVTRFS